MTSGSNVSRDLVMGTPEWIHESPPTPRFENRLRLRSTPIDSGAPSTPEYSDRLRLLRSTPEYSDRLRSSIHSGVLRSTPVDPIDSGVRWDITQLRGSGPIVDSDNYSVFA
uniref:Uncharacterized protein n=1 Tax=Anopheles culicifacies TaxID=139723 RepID=A0A182M915_9DIPT